VASGPERVQTLQTLQSTAHDRPRRLVFTCSMPQFAADIDRITVEVEPDGDGCILTLTHDGLRPGYEQSTVSGWGKTFDALAKTFDALAKTFS
jgi:hypothetical protein